MKLCVPTVDDAGLSARPDDHFGSAPFFTLVDVESGALEILPNRERHRGHGTCRPLAQLDGRGLDGLVCRGIGRRAAASLEASGLDVFVSDASTVGAIVEQARQEALRRLDPAMACGGHGHRHRGEGGRRLGGAGTAGAGTAGTGTAGVRSGTGPGPAGARSGPLSRGGAPGGRFGRETAGGGRDLQGGQGPRRLRRRRRSGPAPG